MNGKVPVKTPTKKPIYKKWWFWVIAVIVFSYIVSPFLPEAEPAQTALTPAPTEMSTINPTEKPTPEPTSTPNPTEAPTEAPVVTKKPSTNQTEKPTQTPVEQTPEPVSITVYITDTGKSYHRSDCQHLSKSKHSITLEDAKERGYSPCGSCHPPQ